MGLLVKRSLAVILGTIAIDMIIAFEETNQNGIANNSTMQEPELTCPGKVIVTASHLSGMKSESQIAIDDHLSGLKPLTYDVQLKVMNFAEFDASVTILMKSVLPTRTLTINFDVKVLTVNPNNIRLYLLKADFEESDTFHDSAIQEEREICFEKTLKSVEENSLLIMGIQETLDANRYFLLKVIDYSGRVNAYPKGMPFWKKHTLPPRSLGLRRTDQDLPSAALYTLFQMRLARTVFPSFDHPIFKTNFSVCIEHDKSTVALSNTMAYSRLDKNSSIVECFKTTPKIPIYAFTFSILENFTVVKDQEGSTSIEVYYANHETASHFDWQKEHTKNVLTYIKQKFEVELGVDRLAFLNLRPCIMWGIENYGLISVDAKVMAEKRELSRSILVHEIVHQWLGNDVTISYWDDICLQEGLTAYLEGYISEALNFTLPLKDNVANKVTYMLNEYPFINSAPIGKFNFTQDIPDHCFGYPFIVFYMMREAYGEDIWTTFLKRLFKEHQFGNANFTQWIQILDEIAPASTNETMSAGQFLQKWFTSEGYPVSYVRVRDDEVSIIQKAAYGKQDWYRLKGFYEYMSDASVIRPIKYKVITANDGNSTEKDVFVDRKVFTFKSNSNASKWIVLDPAGVTMTRTLYEPEIYMRIINCFKFEPNCPISVKRIKQIFNDFCFALSHNGIFTSTEEKSVARQNIPAWNNLLDSIYNLSLAKTIDIPNSCSCCFKPKSLLIDEPSRYGSCKSVWNSQCRHRELMNLIGRGYVLLY